MSARSRWYNGYKIHAAVCARTELPVTWEVATARDHEASYAEPLLDALIARGFSLVETCAMDKGYDTQPIHTDVRPIIPLKKTPSVKRGDHLPPTCEHGTWKPAGADFERKRTKWTLPYRRVCPVLRMDRGFSVAPADPPRDEAMGRPLPGTCLRRAHLRPLEARVRVEAAPRARPRTGAASADLTMLARLSQALVRARVAPLAA